MNVKSLRKKLDATQETFAYLLCFTTVSVNRWEKGHAEPSDYSAAVLELLKAALKKQTPTHVRQGLVMARGDQVEVLRVLVRIGDS